jgi:opacity protein-like surface antigen
LTFNAAEVRLLVARLLPEESNSFCTLVLSVFLISSERARKGTFVYGGGADWPLLKHVTLRTEYRGLVYKAPDFGLRSLNTDAVTHTAQPSVGIAFHF